MTAGDALLSGFFLAELIFSLVLRKNRPVGDIVLVYIADVLNRFSADFFGGHNLHIVKP